MEAIKKYIEDIQEDFLNMEGRKTLHISGSNDIEVNEDDMISNQKKV